MPKGSSASSSHVASFADYNSDDGEINETRQRATNANVALKRSGGLGKDSPSMSPPPDNRRPIPDRSSDSGYSSRTQVTNVSADSSQSVAGAEQASSVASELHTAASSGCRDYEVVVLKDGKKVKKCTDPNCPKKRQKSKKSKQSKGESSSAKPSASSSTRQPSKERSAPKTKEEEPQSTRPQMRPRAASANNARPNSYHGAMPGYFPQGRPATYYYRSGYPMHHPAGMALMMPGRTPMERPAMPRLATEGLSARGGAKTAGPYGAPILRQDKPKTVLSARTPTESRYSRRDAEEEEENDDDDDDDDDYLDDEVTRKLKRHEAQQAQIAVELERRRKLAEFDARARALKLERDAAAMPPPSRPASSLKPSISMRQAGPSTNAKVTYAASHSPLFDDLDEPLRNLTLGTRPGLSTLGAGAKGPYSTSSLETRGFLSSDSARLGHNRPNSYYGGETFNDLERQHQVDLERQHQALIARSGDVARQYEAAHRMRSHIEATQGYDPQMLRDRFRRGSRDNVDDTTPRNTEAQMREAQSHINRSRSQGASNKRQPLTEGSLRQAERDSTRPRRPSRDGSSTASARRPSTTSQSQIESLYDANGFKLKINPKQPYEFDLGNQRVELRPNGEGMEFVYVGEKRETAYYTGGGSVSTGSKLGRKSSHRSRPQDHDSEEEEELDQRRSRRDTPRRRAETVSYLGSESSRRTARRASTSREDTYRGPPLYGTSRDEYGPPTARYSQGYSREPPSPRPGRGGLKQNYSGFGA
jgi:hypothetical protein